MAYKTRREEPSAIMASPEASVKPDHIKIIKGSTDILLIAPHACIRDGKPKDDENTGPITEMVAHQIGCSAIINTHFHKPDSKKYPRGMGKGNLDLNVIADAELVPGYLDAIRAVVNAPGKTTVLWIHGADNKNAVEVASRATYAFPGNKIHAFIGYGQGGRLSKSGSKNLFTAKPETVKRFCDALIRNGMNAVLTDKDAVNYRGRRTKGMNQWFLNQEYTLDQVESIQLEIRKAGFRDLHHNIEKTAGILIEALSQEALVPVIPEETVADEHLVDIAFNHLRGIFAKHIHEAMLQAGRYLVRTFYGTYEKARKKEKIRKQSFAKLEERLNNGTGDAPKKTWIYDAVKVAVDDHFFRKESKAFFLTYGKLGHSQKVLLTQVKDTNQKKKLVAKAIEEAQTVKQFRKSIRALNPPKDSKPEPKGRFRDWTDPKNNVNICTGCENDCIYCYAKSMALRWKQVEQEQWPQMKVRQADVNKPRKLYDGLVGFPSSHDITPANIDAYLTVLGKLLRANNKVLIVSKPRMDCIKPICDACRFFRDEILFRFTIGAMDDEVLGFWEPNAPAYEERKACLEYAFNAGFKTSVSMEPMLDTPRIEQQIEDLRPFVTEDIWLGTMNHLRRIKKKAGKDLLGAIAKVEAGQTAEMLTAIHQTYKDDPQIKWKTDALKIMEAHKQQEIKS